MATRRGRDDSLVRSAAFRALVALLAVALLVTGALFGRILEEAVVADGLLGLRPLASSLDSPPSPPGGGAEEGRQPHLYPRLPHLPAFPAIENEDALINRTLYEGRPTIAGIAAVLYRHLRALHESNSRLAAKLASEPKRGGEKKREEEADAARSAYFDLMAASDLRVLEEAYRGGPVFPVREDDSIFVSVASFREHLLADTLMSAFDRAAR